MSEPPGVDSVWETRSVSLSTSRTGIEVYEVRLAFEFARVDIADQKAPHKFKGGVSGCVRECAEAQSKDFGLIATDKGWNSRLS